MLQARIRRAAELGHMEPETKLVLLLLAIDADADSRAAVAWNSFAWHAGGMEEDDILACLRSLERQGHLSIIEADRSREGFSVLLTV